MQAALHFTHPITGATASLSKQPHGWLTSEGFKYEEFRSKASALVYLTGNGYVCDTACTFCGGPVGACVEMHARLLLTPDTSLDGAA